MKGIKGQPYIDLDQHIDIDGFRALDHKMCYGIAKSYWDQGNYGPGIYDRSAHQDLFWLEADIYNRRHPDWEELSKLQFEDINQRRKYLKLRYGVYNPSHTIYLKKPSGRNYYSIANSSENPWTDNKKHFPELVAWIERLPFESIGRVIFFVHEHDCDLVMHSDLKYSKEPSEKYKANSPHETEFVWIRPNMGKNFFVYDEERNERMYVKGYSAFFNSYDVHGGDATDTMTYSLRVDGTYTSEFRKQLGL